MADTIRHGMAGTIRQSDPARHGWHHPAIRRERNVAGTIQPAVTVLVRVIERGGGDGRRT